MLVLVGCVLVFNNKKAFRVKLVIHFRTPCLRFGVGCEKFGLKDFLRHRAVCKLIANKHCDVLVADFCDCGVYWLVHGGLGCVCVSVSGLMYIHSIYNVKHYFHFF